MDKFKNRVLNATSKISGLKNKRENQETILAPNENEYEFLFNTLTTLKDKLDEFMDSKKSSRRWLNKLNNEASKSIDINDFTETKVASWLSSKVGELPETMNDACFRLIKTFEMLAKIRETKRDDYVEEVRNEILNNVELPGYEIKKMLKLLEKKKTELLKLQDSQNPDFNMIQLSKAEFHKLKESRDSKISTFMNNHKQYIHIIDHVAIIMTKYFKQALGELKNLEKNDEKINQCKNQNEQIRSRVSACSISFSTKDIADFKREKKTLTKNVSFNKTQNLNDFETMKPGMLLLVKKSFTPVYTDELECRVGETLVFVDKVDNNWIECYNMKRFGILPCKNVQVSTDDEVTDILL